MELREAKSLEEIKELENGWNRLPKKSLFLSFDWITSWFECRKESKPWVLGAWNGSKLVGIAPLDFEGGNLQFAGQQYGNHLDFVAAKGAEQQVAKAFAGRIVENKEWKKIEFKHLVDSPILLGALEEAAAEKGFVARKSQGEGSSVVALPPTMEEYFAGLKKKLRKNLKNDLSRLERAFKVETSLLGQGEFEEGWKRFIEMHLQNISARKAKSILEQHWFQCFYKSAAEKASRSGKLFLLQLSLDEKPAGVLLGIVFGKTLNVLNIGYAQADEKQSLGTVLFLKAIESCCEKGFDTYDLLAGGADYKKKFGALEKSRLQIEVFRSERNAKAAGLKKKVKEVGKKLLR